MKCSLCKIHWDRNYLLRAKEKGIQLWICPNCRTKHHLDACIECDELIRDADGTHLCLCHQQPQASDQMIRATFLGAIEIPQIPLETIQRRTFCNYVESSEFFALEQKKLCKAQFWKGDYEGFHALFACFDGYRVYVFMHPANIYSLEKKLRKPAQPLQVKLAYS